MKPVAIEGMTRDLVKPRDWDDEKNGTCGSLEIRDEEFRFGNGMISHWKPSENELKILNEGGVVQLCVCGEVHPPVALSAEKV
jgi:hypothetical protein